MTRTSPAFRLPQLFLGLATAAFGIVLTLRADLGVSPWDVLHAGLADATGLSFGVTLQLVGAVVLVASLFLGVRPGFGTICNLVLIGACADLLTRLGLADGLGDEAVVLRLLVLLTGVALVGVAGALYIGAHFGAGPRDGLMVALHRRAGWSIGAARTLIEASALVLGVALGGPVGIGTLLFTVLIGPATQVAFRVLRMTPVRETTAEPI